MNVALLLTEISVVLREVRRPTIIICCLCAWYYYVYDVDFLMNAKTDEYIDFKISVVSLSCSRVCLSSQTLFCVFHSIYTTTHHTHYAPHRITQANPNNNYKSLKAIGNEYIRSNYEYMKLNYPCSDKR
jgi:hypothetical protein